MGRLPTAFVTHGGGPWPLIPLDVFDESERLSLKAYFERIKDIPASQPKAILLISAHWEGPNFTLNTNPDPKLLFDYYGFPDEAYDFQWSPRTDLVLASEVEGLIRDKGFDVDSNNKRDFDHGVYIPLMLSYPNAEVPIVQLSLRRNLSPEDHLKCGEALASLRDQGVFIIGSGNSYHNIGQMFSPSTRSIQESKQFDHWLKEALSLDDKSRRDKLVQWQMAPGAKQCHPREEHLLPLMVVVGAAGVDDCHVTWSGSVNGTSNSAFHFG